MRHYKLCVCQKSESIYLVLHQQKKSPVNLRWHVDILVQVSYHNNMTYNFTTALMHSMSDRSNIKWIIFLFNSERMLFK